MTIPKPTQLSGAKFLAERQYALLADLPRVGKTGSTVIAADYVMAETILVVTTASGRGVWKAGLPNWSTFDRPLQVMLGKSKLDPKIPSAIVGWNGITSPALRYELLKRKWDLIIPDEVHNAKNFEAKRTQSLYGELQSGTLGAEAVNDLGDAAFASVTDETSLLQVRSGPYLLTLASRATGELDHQVPVARLDLVALERHADLGAK